MSRTRVGNSGSITAPPPTEYYPQESIPLVTSETETLPAGHAFIDTLRLSPTQQMFQEAGPYTANVTFDVQGNSTAPRPDGRHRTVRQS